MSMFSFFLANQIWKPEPDNHVNVFVLSGQSNMEGSTTYVSDKGDQWLRNAFEKLKLFSQEII